MGRRVMLVAVLTLGVLPLAAGCGGSSPGSESTSTESSSGGGGQKTIAGVEANDHGTKAVEDSGKTEVELDDYYFEPTVLEGKPGQTVTLELKNEGQVEHTFTIDSQGIDQDVQPADEAEVDVTIPTYGNLWRAEAGHALRLELTNVDSPYITPSRVPSVTTVTGVRLVVPVRGGG